MEKIIKTLLNNGGVTLALHTDTLGVTYSIVERDFGYQVASRQMEVIIDMSHCKALDMIVTTISVMSKINRYDNIGLWINPDTNLCHIDYSNYFSSKLNAMQVAEANQQLAVYEWHTGNSITV